MAKTSHARTFEYKIYSMVYEWDKVNFSTILNNAFKIILDSDFCHNKIDTLILPLKTEYIVYNYLIYILLLWRQ
jgi:hypothetical protein